MRLLLSGGALTIKEKIKQGHIIALLERCSKDFL